MKATVGEGLQRDKRRRNLGDALSADRLAAIRQGDESAIRGVFECLYIRLAPLAARITPPGHDPSEVVTSFLDQFLLNLPHLAFDRAGIDPYVVTAFRNHLRQLIRNDAVRQKRYDLASQRSGASELLVAECQSEYSVSSAADKLHDEAPANDTRAMAKHLASRLTQDEKALLRALSGGASVRETAGWLGLEYGTCRVRIHRLRVKLRVEALGYAESAPDPEKRHLARFFRRLGLSSPAVGVTNE